MKLLIWHCSSLQSRDIRKSSRPRGIRELVGRPTTVKFTDVLVIFACVEKGDTAETMVEGGTEILRLSEQIGRHEVVVVPFAHLSSELMIDSEQAQALINVLAENLDRLGLKVTTSSFGYHKQFELHYVAKGYPGSVAFRDVTTGKADAQKASEGAGDPE